MRVLVMPATFPSPVDANASGYVLRQCQELTRRGHDVHVAYVVPMAPPVGEKWKAYRAIPSRYTYEGIAVDTIRALVPPRMLNLGFVRLQVQVGLRRLIARVRPDIVHVHCVVPPGFIAMGLDYPTVITAHGSDAYAYPRQRGDIGRAASAALRSADAVVAVSAFIKRQVEQLGAVDVDVVYNGADPRFFSPGDRREARERFGFPADRPLIVFAGTVERAKGLLVLADALKLMADLRPVVAIAGRGPDSVVIKDALATTGGDAYMLGFLGQEQIAQLLAAADVVTLPSYGEGLPTALCEAMLAGRAIVASNVGGIPEIVRNGESGLIVPPGDAEALASALTAILSDIGLKTRFEARAHEFATEHLTWEVNAQAYEGIFTRALDRYARRRRNGSFVPARA